MDRETFAERFRRASQKARTFAQSFLEEELPSPLRFRVRLNASHVGDRLRADERVFPEDNYLRPARSLSNVDEAAAVATLWREGLVPEWIDLSVVGETGAATLVEARTSGRFTANDALLYYRDEFYQELHIPPPGLAPFQVLGPSLPWDHVDGRRFSIYNCVQLWEAGELEHAAKHADRVRSLQLCGEAFDDDAVAELPVFPKLELLAFSGVRVRGRGLSSLSQFPSLRGMQLDALDPAHIDVGDAPGLGGMMSLLMTPAPASPWGFGQWVERLPRLDWLQLTTKGPLFVDGRLPRRMKWVTLSGTSLGGGPRLGEQMEGLSLEFPGMSEAELDVLLEPVREVKTLSLDETAVGDAFVRRIAERWDLRRLNVRNTRVSVDCLRELRAKHPHLRTGESPQDAPTSSARSSYRARSTRWR